MKTTLMEIVFGIEEMAKEIREKYDSYDLSPEEYRLNENSVKLLNLIAEDVLSENLEKLEFNFTTKNKVEIIYFGAEIFTEEINNTNSFVCFFENLTNEKFEIGRKDKVTEKIESIQTNHF